MPPEDILQRLRQQPFEPFRIHLSDGTVYEIRHPDVVLVGRRSLTLGLASTGEPRLPYDRFETVSLLHVTRLEPVNGSPAA
jgi:hypothetical protein